MRKKLIHTLPEQLDSNLLHQLEEREGKQWKIVDPVGIDLTKTAKESNPAETEEDIDLFEEEESQSETGTK